MSKAHWMNNEHGAGGVENNMTQPKWWGNSGKLHMQHNGHVLQLLPCLQMLPMTMK
jgi:hypothetical protein